MGDTQHGRITARLLRMVTDQQLLLSVLAVGVGVVAALGAILFREGIEFFQIVFLGFASDHVASFAAKLPDWRVVLAPVVGGVLVGVLIKFFFRGHYCPGVAQAIEANAVHGGRMSTRDGVFAALASAISIGSGASVGREGPVVHLGASLGSTLGGWFRLDRNGMRIMLGAGVAAGVAACFNAPIAGVFFAHELIIGHYALMAFAPVAIASITGTVISRLYFGDHPEFIIAEFGITSFWEMPAFALLGVVASLVAIAFIRLVPMVQNIYRRLRVPVWASPAIGGLLVGLLALQFPEVLGVGYEATNRALGAEYTFQILVTLAIAKFIASVICLGSGLAGGAFSPSLFIGAMVGGAFGGATTLLFPEFVGSLGAYTITGMGAVVAAVLGAPLSTTFMVFELTGDYKLTIVVLIAVVFATVFARTLHGPSFFLHALAQDGVDLTGGHDVGSLSVPWAGELMREDHLIMDGSEGLPALRRNLLIAPHGEVFVMKNSTFLGRLVLSDLGERAYDDSEDKEFTVEDLVTTRSRYVYRNDKLDQMIQVFSSTEDSLIAVLESPDDRRVVGCLHERDVVRAEEAYARTLERLRAEEH